MQKPAGLAGFFVLLIDSSFDDQAFAIIGISARPIGLLASILKSTSSLNTVFLSMPSFFQASESAAFG